MLLNDFLDYYVPYEKEDLSFKLNVLYSICFYLSEVVVLQVLSNSLKWSLRTSKRYRSNKAQRDTIDTFNTLNLNTDQAGLNSGTPSLGDFS